MRIVAYASMATIILLTGTTVLSFSVQTYASKDSNCESSYPDVCILPPPPQLNCDDISDNNFKVLPPDPHGFDSEGDGIGCETEP